MQISRTSYVNNLKGHHDNKRQTIFANLPHRLAMNICVDCNRVYRSLSGLRCDMTVNNRFVGRVHPINPISNTEFNCHICMISMESNVGTKSQLRDHERQNEMESFTSDAENKESTIIM